MFGYHGCYLRIDVTHGRVERVPIAEAVLRQFIGGSDIVRDMHASGELSELFTSQGIAVATA